MNLQRACEHCATYFSSPHWEQRRFCSVKCRNRAINEKRRHKGEFYDAQICRNCEHCGKEFVTWPSEIARGSGRFCGRECYQKSRASPIADRFWSKVRKTETCWLWTGANSGRKWPYGLLGGKPMLKAHHISWEIHNGPVPEGAWVLHKCDVTLCVNPDHLFLGTAADNTADMMVKGRCATRKLTQDQVDQIRRRYALGETQIALAVDFGVSKANVSIIVQNKSWKH
jgi:hypothetical protein